MMNTVYTIVIYACSLIDPSSCQNYNTIAYDLSPIQAYQYVEAQGIVAQWSNLHPNLKIEKFEVINGQGI